MTVKVTVKLESVERIRKEVQSQAIKKQAANLLIDQIKTFIAKGISPVFGFRRFPAYKNPDKYPADKKPKRPVNLKLSGDMLQALTFRDRAKFGIEIGWFGGKQAKKAGNHNDGDTVPQRKILPTKKGERFNVSITRKLKGFYSQVISDILKGA